MFRTAWPLGRTALVAVFALFLSACGDLPASVDDAKATASDTASDTVSAGDSAGDVANPDTLAGCLAQNTCTASGLHCDPVSGSCVACLGDSDCGDGATCQGHQCAPGGSCDGSPPQCESLSKIKVCDPISHMWTTSACSGTTVCSGGACVALKCAPSKPFCDGQSAAKCSDDGLSSSFVQDCAALGQDCLNGQCAVQACSPGATVCQGSQVALCAPDGLSQQILFDCAMYGAICTGGACQKVPCTPGGLGCLDKSVVKCDASGYTPIEDCTKKGQTCQDGACVEAVCMPGESTCTGTQLAYCNNTGSAWQIVTDCAAMPGGLGTCLAGNCVEVPCLPGGVGCQGDVAVQCGATPDITPLEDCTVKGLVCVSGACLTPICQPNESVCDGNKVMYCAGGKQWVDGGDCAAYGSGTCYQGQCILAPCPPGGVGCAGTDLVQCDNAGSWTVLVPCASKAQVCSGGACIDPVCEPNAVGCNGAIVMACAADGTEWNEAQDCASSGLFCDQGKCIAQLCVAGTGGCLGNSVATCAAGGMSWNETPCGGQLCNAGLCTPAKCLPPKTYPADAVWMHWIEPTAATGCDLNGDGQVDNALQKMIGVTLAGGQGPYGGKPFVVTLVADAYSSSGATFALQVLPSLVTGGATCDPFGTAPQTCPLMPDLSGYNLSSSAPTCPATSGWLDAKVVAGQLQAGGPSATISLPMTAAPSASFFALKGARLTATVPSGGGMASLPSGTLCGWLTKADIETLIDNLPPGFYAQAGGLDAATLKSVVFQQSKADIDSDGNGSLDAYSFGLGFSGDPVKLSATVP